jgi:hypothetical protein
LARNEWLRGPRRSVAKLAMWTLAGFTDFGAIVLPDFSVILLPGFLDLHPDESAIATDGSRLEFRAGDIEDLVTETEAWLRSH